MKKFTAVIKGKAYVFRAEERRSGFGGAGSTVVIHEEDRAFMKGLTRKERLGVYESVRELTRKESLQYVVDVGDVDEGSKP